MGEGDFWLTFPPLAFSPFIYSLPSPSSQILSKSKSRTGRCVVQQAKVLRDMSFTSGQYYIRLAKRRAGSECAKTVRKVSAKRVVRRFGEHVCIPPVGLIFECAKWPEHLSVIIVIFATEGGENLGGKGGNRERQGKGSREIWKDIMSNDGTFQYVRTNTVSFRNTVLTYGVRNLEPWLQLVFPEPNFFYLLRLYFLSDILLPRLNFVTCTNKIKWEFQFQVYEKYLFIDTHILHSYVSFN